MSLRSTGHLLLGVIRVFDRKAEIFESETQEFHSKLVMTFTGNRKRYPFRHVAEPAFENLDLGDSQLLHSPEGGWEYENAEVGPDDPILLSGRKHVADIENITLRPLSPVKRERFDSMDDAFECLTGEERVAMDKFIHAVNQALGDGISMGLADSFESAPLCDPEQSSLGALCAVAQRSA